jgi:pyridoxal phosphate enzyme (YggS family)
MTIAKNLKALKTSLPEEVILVAVSKTKSNEAIMEAYATGQRLFGENKVQEMVQKHETLPKDIEWHMIGHLQRNKVKYMASFVYLIHGVDTEKLLVEINKQAAKHQRSIPCLLQVHIAEESTKFGFAESELTDLIGRKDEFPNVEIKGLMGMASFTDNTEQVQQEFRGLKKLFDQFFKKMDTAVLSMGMSGDYPIAIAEGSTLIRVGSKIFGARNY